MVIWKLYIIPLMEAIYYTSNVVEQVVEHICMTIAVKIAQVHYLSTLSLDIITAVLSTLTVAVMMFTMFVLVRMYWSTQPTKMAEDLQ